MKTSTTPAPTGATGERVPGPAPEDAPPFFIIPADLDFRLAPGEVATSERAWMFMLQQWHLGHDPSLRSLRSMLGWSWERLTREYVACRDWAIAVNNNMPDAVRTRVPGQQREAIDNGGPFEMPGLLSHADVVARAARWLRGHHRCAVVATELVTACPITPDAIGWRMSWSVLVEAKVSRSDFKADRKKPIHLTPDTMPGQERWYLTPPNLVRPEEVPDGWGLAECGKSSIRIVVTPARRFDTGFFVDGRSRAEMPILLSLIRRENE